MTDKEAIKNLEFLKIAFQIDAKPINFKVETLDFSITALDKIYQIREITERALRSEDPINLYKALCLKQIADILGIRAEAPAEDTDKKGQITFDDIL